MRMHKGMKKVVAASLISLVAGIQVMAADLQSGTALVDEISDMASKAATEVAEAAKTGDLVAMSNAQAKKDAIEKALVSAEAALKEMTIALDADPQDQAAADQAFADIEQAKKDAVNPPEKRTATKKKKRSGGRGSIVPNIYENPGDTAAQQAIQQTTTDIATANGGGQPLLPGAPVTPE